MEKKILETIKTSGAVQLQQLRKGVFIGAFSITDVGNTGNNTGRTLKDISGFLEFWNAYEYLEVCNNGLLAIGYVDKEYYDCYGVVSLKESVKGSLAMIEEEPRHKDLYSDGQGHYYYLY